MRGVTMPKRTGVVRLGLLRSGQACRRRSRTLVWTAAVLAIGAPLVWSTSAAAIPGARLFGYSRSEQSHTVPSNVMLLGVDVVGASGGGNFGVTSGASLGGYLPVHGGETLYAEVGQQGAFAGGATFGGGGAAGGYPACSVTCPQNTFAGSGGGASDVRSCSASAASCPGGVNSGGSRLIVAVGVGEPAVLVRPPGSRARLCRTTAARSISRTR